MLDESGTNLLEPIMYLEIASPEEYISLILGDLGRKKADILNVEFKNNMKVSFKVILYLYSLKMNIISADFR